MYYTVFTGKYHESVALLSPVPQTQVTIWLQTSDVSLYTLYNTFIMCSRHWNALTSILRYYLVTGHCGLTTIVLAISVLTVQPHSQAVWDLPCYLKWLTTTWFAVGEGGLLSFFDSLNTQALSKLAAAPLIVLPRQVHTSIRSSPLQ